MINLIQHKQLQVNGGRPLLNLGEPELIKFTSNIQLPKTGISDFKIIDSKYSVIDSINIIPSKGNLYRNIDPDLIPFNKGPYTKWTKNIHLVFFHLVNPISIEI